MRATTSSNTLVTYVPLGFITHTFFRSFECRFLMSNYVSRLRNSFSFGNGQKSLLVDDRREKMEDRAIKFKEDGRMKNKKTKSG